MKFQQSWPLRTPAQAKLVWNRMTFSPLTLIYLAFSVVHFVLQLSLQIRAFTINANAASFLGNILIEANATTNSLPFQRKSNISLCTWVSSNLDVEVESCHVVWSPEMSRNVEAEDRTQNGAGGFPLVPLPLASSTISSSPSVMAALASTVSIATTTTFTNLGPVLRPRPTSTVTTTIFVVPTAAVKTKTEYGNGVDGGEGSDVTVYFFTGLSGIFADSFGKQYLTRRDLTIKLPNGKDDATLDDTCIESLNWPVSVLRNTKREDIVSIAFQFWVLGMSIVALLNESMPHIIASLLTHMMATAWAAFQITHTANFRATFGRVITNGACKGSVLLPTFWEARAHAEYPSLALHVVALFISCFLTWKLMKLFGWQTFKRVGASLTINRIYKIVLILSITIQLSLFFMAVTVSLWIDQLLNSPIGDLADFTKVYKISSFITLALLIPWLMTGWFAVRRELRLPMFFFLILSILYLAAWGVMFFSTTFRWTFTTWRFFSVMASASVLLTCISFILGVVCRFNFGKGLVRYLNGQSSSGDDDQSSMYDEKKDIETFPFPTTEALVPTFTLAYGPDVRYSKQSSPSRGPRFFNASAEPFEKAATNIAPPAPALTRNLTDIPQVRRSDSNGSDKSTESYGSLHTRSDGSSHSREGSQAKRWVIE